MTTAGAGLTEEACPALRRPGYRCACESAAVERASVRTTARPTGRLTVVRPVRLSRRLVSAQDSECWWLLPVPLPRL